MTALEAAHREGSLFVAAGREHAVAATTDPDEPAGLVLYDLRTVLRKLGEDEMRKLAAGALLALGSVGGVRGCSGAGLRGGSGWTSSTRTAAMLSLPGTTPEAQAALAPRARSAAGRRAGMTHAELGRALADHALLHGDFVLRSGRRSRYYLDKYRFETRPDLLAARSAS